MSTQPGSSVNVLLVEDNADYASELVEFLGSHGLRTVWIDTLDDLARRVADLSPTVLVLDQFVGGRDSLMIISALRRGFQGGVMVLTGNQDPFDRIVALETGADDFVAKSLGPRELLARVRAVSRRAASATAADTATEAEAPPRASNSPWKLDPRRVEVLIRASGELVTRDTLSAEVLKRQFSPFDRSVDNMVSRIRRALKPHLGGQEAINAIRGQGYVFSMPGPIELVSPASDEPDEP
jgi:DNA-binding response OmpR family regulator